MLRQLSDGVENHLALVYDNDRLLPAASPFLASTTHLGGARGPGLLKALGRLVGVVRQIQPDVVHAQLIRAQIIARAAAWVNSRPIVTTWQNPYYSSVAVVDFRSRWQQELIRRIDAWSGRSDAAFVAVSAFVGDECGRALHVPPDRIRVIHNAVEFDRLAPADPNRIESLRRELEVPGSAPILLSVGRLVPQKRHSDLIHAMPTVLSSHPEAVLLIAGGGPLLDSLKQMVSELGLERRVRLLGSRSDVPLLYQLADAFVFPSVFEGLSVALVEALASGLPAVVSDIPPNREAGADLESVKYVSLNDTAGLAAAVVDVLNRRRELRPVAAQGGLGIRERFSPALLAGQLRSVLAEAATRRHGT
jgi:glycosyltransferase involved in cell wall biosynthesis